MFCGRSESSPVFVAGSEPNGKAARNGDQLADRDRESGVIQQTSSKVCKSFEDDMKSTVFLTGQKPFGRFCLTTKCGA